MNTISLPLRQDVPLRDQCSHGKLWVEQCDDCEIFMLESGLEERERELNRDKARLRELYERDGLVEHIAELAKLVAEMVPYMDHIGYCRERIIGGYDQHCTCRLNDVLARAKG